jgi:hypothetical protein
VKCKHGVNMTWHLLTLRQEKFKVPFRSILVRGVFNDAVSTADVKYCEIRWLDKYERRVRD